MGRFWVLSELSLVLTQEFLLISASLPHSLCGHPAIQFYMSTMPPTAFLLFPATLAKLHTVMSFRWFYHHGNPAQLHSAHLVELIMLKECLNLARFLTPASNTAAQASAYRVIANALAPPLEPHRFETFNRPISIWRTGLMGKNLRPQRKPEHLCFSRRWMMSGRLSLQSR